MGTRIRGLLTVVPSGVRTADELAARYGREETERTVATTGVRRMHVVSPGQTAGDLAEEAARRLLAKLGIAPGDVQGIVFVSQTPDFILPATACLLQHRLGLPKQSLAFDVNLGCSAYPYGLAIAGGLLALGLAERILLLAADTPSLLTHPEDRAARPLFGDAATATLLERDSEADDLLAVDLGTDGAGWRNLIQPVGQCRYPSLGQFLTDAPEELRRLAYPEHVQMNGAEIFTFTLREVPGIVRRTLAAAKLPDDAVDYYFFHQANKFILDHLIRKMRLPAEKCPMSIGPYGNTSGPSPAVTACHAAADANRDRDLLAMFVGFGVGYSWGGALARLRRGVLLPIEESCSKESSPD
jgi:3-oxoacyl-[acyl-carrier-protein] synthase-3